MRGNRISTRPIDISKGFSKEELLKVVETLEALSPVAVKMDVYPRGYNVLKQYFLNQNTKPVGYALFGLSVYVIEEKDDTFNETQAKIYYSDGSYKILEIIGGSFNESEIYKLFD